MPNTEEQYLFLINRLLHGDITPNEREELMHLAKDDADKLVLIKYLSSTSDTAQMLESEIVYEKTKPNDLIKSGATVSTTKTFKIIKPLYKIGVAAASLLILFLSYLYYFQLANNKSEDKWEYISTRLGERKFVTLNDGTEIWLNNESELKILKGYGVQHRKMVLTGEGYFSVAKNSELPLYVQTKDTEVKVLGTVFNLSSYPESDVTTTSLIEGKVSLKIIGSNNTKEIIMNPGDQVKISKANIGKLSTDLKVSELLLTEAVSYTKVDLKDNKVTDILWVDNKLVFNNLPLSEIVMKLRRWYNKEIVIENDELADLSFSGTFQERECTQVLDLLMKTGLKINYEIKNNTIYIH